MRQNCPSYRIGDRDDFSEWNNFHTYTMIFSDDCSHHARYVQYDVEIRKLAYCGELRDYALLKTKRFTVDRGTRLSLIVEVLANLSGNKEILERLAHELFWTQELSLDKEPGLYAEYFPEEYDRLIKSQLFHRNKQVEEVMNE